MTAVTVATGMTVMPDAARKRAAGLTCPMAWQMNRFAKIKPILLRLMGLHEIETAGDISRPLLPRLIMSMSSIV